MQEEIQVQVLELLVLEVVVELQQLEEMEVLQQQEMVELEHQIQSQDQMFHTLVVVEED